MNFTVEEINLINIYKANTRTGQLSKLQLIRTLYENEPEMLTVIDSATRKLTTMTDTDFLEIDFIPVYPTIYDEGETESFAHGKPGNIVKGAK